MSSYFTPATIPPLRSKRGEPAWEIAMLFPAQGYWPDHEYLALGTNHVVELVNGFLEVHPSHSLRHQRILGFLLRGLGDFAALHALGEVVCAPFPVQIAARTFREPDLVFLRPGRLEGPNPRSVVGADLALEVVSEGADNRTRDLVTKPLEYAAAGISEYWIVDPELQTITVLALVGAAYVEHGVFRVGETATSRLLPGLVLSVQEAFAAGNPTA